MTKTAFNSNTNAKLLHNNARSLPKYITGIVQYLKLVQTIAFQGFQSYG